MEGMEVSLEPDEFVEELLEDFLQDLQEKEASQEKQEEEEASKEVVPVGGAEVVLIDSDDEGSSAALVQAPAPKAKVQYGLRTFFQGVKEPPVLLQKRKVQSKGSVQEVEKCRSITAVEECLVKKPVEE